MDNIKVLKLTTGEELIAQVDDMENQVRLTNTARFFVSQDRQGQPTMGIATISPFIEESDVLEIDKKFIVWMGNPKEEVMTGYKEKFGGVTVITAPKLVY